MHIESEKELAFEIEQKPSTIPFIYSDLQTINLDEKKDSYKLKFKTDLYQGEKLGITERQENISFSMFDTCAINETELTCIISSEKIEEVLTNKTDLNLVLLSDSYGVMNFEFSGDIHVIYTKPKEEIHLIITKALNNITEENSYFSLETNITEISPLTSDVFELQQWTQQGTELIKCYFKKYTNDNQIPLLLLCKSNKDDIDFIIDSQITLTSINYKCDFIIEVSDIKEHIQVKENPNPKNIIIIYPEILDFSY